MTSTIELKNINQYSADAAIPVPEFTVWASISKTQLYREVSAGRLKLTKRGFRSFVMREDAQSWLDSLRHRREVWHEPAS